ncbi:hypothetical protein JCM10450v2_007727 [Rhodotorula kratochvilovae]
MFTPLPSFVGGLLLSYSTSALLLTQGRVLGCSGVAHGTIASIVSSVVPGARQGPRKGDKKVEHGAAPAVTDGWKVATLGGLFAGGALLRLLRPELEAWVGAAIFDAPLSAGTAGLGRVVLAGLLVGAGTKLANGCTSGHMLLGLARLSKRSFAAVVTFFATALLTSRLAPSSVTTRIVPSGTLVPLSPTLPPLIALALFALPPLLSLPPLLRSRRASSTTYHHLLHSFLLGMTFTLGLALAGMTRPSKVLSFFYVPLPGHFLPSPPPGAAWDPSLAMVALGGLLPNMAVWQAVKGWKTPLQASEWSVPSNGGKVDAQLVLGSAAFGIGWGLMGICPGPLFAVLGAGSSISGSAISVFAGAFAVGGLAAGRALA